MCFHTHTRLVGPAQIWIWQALANAASRHHGYTAFSNLSDDEEKPTGHARSDQVHYISFQRIESFYIAIEQMRCCFEIIFTATGSRRKIPTSRSKLDMIGSRSTGNKPTNHATFVTPSATQGLFNS